MPFGGTGAFVADVSGDVVGLGFVTVVAFGPAADFVTDVICVRLGFVGTVGVSDCPRRGGAGGVAGVAVYGV
jgi:hypothetical protein